MTHFILFLARWPFMLVALVLVLPLAFMTAVADLDDTTLRDWWATAYEVLYLDWRKR